MHTSLHQETRYVDVENFSITKFCKSSERKVESTSTITHTQLTPNTDIC
jgi:hypothetical protein